MKVKRSFSFSLLGVLVVSSAFAGEPLRCTVNPTGNGIRWNYFNRGEWLELPIIDFQVKLPPAAEEPAGVPPDVQLAVAAQAPFCGTYISPGVEKPEEITEWPAAATSSTFWRDQDLLPLIANRRIPKLDDPAILLKHSRIMRAELATRPAHCPHVFVDNCGHVDAGWMRGPDGKPQVAFASLMALLRSLREPGRLVIANMAMHPLALSEAETQMLINSVDGVALETGIHPNARTADGLRKLIAFYQRMLAANKIVVLMAINGALEKEIKDASPGATEEQLKALVATARADELRYTAAIGYMLREPGQKLWASAPYFAAAPDWQAYPDKLGAPLGSVIVLHDGTVAREFAGGWLIARPPRWVEVVMTGGT